MRVVIQRVKFARVTVDNKIVSLIGSGMVALLGIEIDDNYDDADWLCRKIANIRIFDDDQGVMNMNVNQVNGEVLVISQFTLHAKTKKGNRPSYIQAAPPSKALPLYQYFVERLGRECKTEVKCGSFGAMMDVEMVNSGPVTIIIDTKAQD